MAKKIVLQQNDNGIKLLFSIKKDGEISNIENCIVRIKFQNSATKEEFQKVAKIVDSENGEAWCTLFRKDLGSVGSYTTEVETTYPNGIRLTDKNPFLIIISEESFEISPEIVEDVPGYTDENLE